MDDTARIKVAFVGGHVRRWHAADIVGEERVDSHTWGMLAIIHILHPSPSRELLGYVTFHDSPGELFSGDIPHGAKKAFPALGAADHEIGERAVAAIDCDYGLSPEEVWWFRFADMAQALLFVRRQVAQGNSLMTTVMGECEKCLKDLLDAGSAPPNAGHCVASIINCWVDRPLSRSLALLESLDV